MIGLRIYNTLTKRKEDFKVPNGNKIKIFVCGPTVYDYCHLGHARTFIAFDVIAKYLRFKGYDLFFLMNITDVAEKLIEKSRKVGMDFLDLSKKFERYFHEDLTSLGIDSIDVFARASDHVTGIIEQIKKLIEDGFAYETDTGVYFNIKKFPDYGRLSNQTKDEISLRPLELCLTKKNPEDFSLWRKVEKEPIWNSPWGKGRPGWHIEDTAIAMKWLGSQYELHGGAIELIFPHHEAEIAQGEAFGGKKPYVKYWMHTGLLKIDRRKMSKSLENMISIRDLLKYYDRKVLRYYFLSTHYRRTINFNEKEIKKSEANIQFIENAIRNFENLPESKDFSNKLGLVEDIENFEREFIKSMDDDFDTSKALRIISRIAYKLRSFTKNHKEIEKISKKKILKIVIKLTRIFGIIDY